MCPLLSSPLVIAKVLPGGGGGAINIVGKRGYTPCLGGGGGGWL